MGWRQTLYTFILRRALAPYLSANSLQKLYSCFDVSLQEGRFSLSDIEINADYLTSKQNLVTFHYVSVKKMQISLTLRDNQNNSSSGSWKNFALGRENSKGVVLEAHIQLEGVVVHVGPRRYQNDCSETKEENSMQAESRTRMNNSTISSYVDAALSSLRLRLDVDSLNLRFIAEKNTSLELNISLIRYHDLESQDRDMHKAIDFSGVAIQTYTDLKKECILKLEGAGRIALRAKNVGISEKLQQDISLNLPNRINMILSESSLGCICRLLHEFRHLAFPDTKKPEPRHYSKRTSPEFLTRKNSDEQQDNDRIKGIVDANRLLEPQMMIRGGILLQDDDTMSFDAFFDANDLSFSSYKSTLANSLIFNKSILSKTENYVHTFLKIYVGEFRIKLSFAKVYSEPSIDYLLLTLSNFDFSSEISCQSSNIHLLVGNVAIETSKVNSEHHRNIETLLHFVQDDDPSTVVTPTPCLQMHASIEGGTKKCFDVRLSASTIVINFKCMSRVLSLWNSLDKVVEKTERETVDVDFPNKEKIKITLWISSLSILIPVEDMPLPITGRLMDRCSYMAEERISLKSTALVLLLEEISLASLDAESDDIAEGVLGEKFSCNRVLLFFTSNNKNGLPKEKRFDILALNGQVPLTLKHSLRSPSDGHPSEGDLIFPTVPDLSSVKAREDDDDEIFASENFEVMDSLRCANPQSALLRDAHQCQVSWEMQVPDLVCDLTIDEIFCVHQAMILIMGQLSSVKDEVGSKDGKISALANPWSACALRIDQICICVHIDKTFYSFKLIGRNWKVFTALCGAQVSCLRMMMYESDVYLATHLCYREARPLIKDLKVNDRCDTVRLRTTRNSLTKSFPILYRSKMFTSLSPESPSFLVDMLNFSDDECSEWTVHLSIYSLTHRLLLDSDSLLFIMHDLISTCAIASEGALKNNDKSNHERNKNKSALTKLFVTVSDCNIDYSSSLNFLRASRLILRVSEIRMSSNMIYPRQALQVFSISFGDIALLIGNKRHSYNAEYACLSRAITILSPEDIDIAVPQPDLQDMNLVTILTLDTIVASITLADSEMQSISNTGTSRGEPNLTFNLMIGLLCFYGCKDSFECLTETFDELMLYFTGYTAEGIERLKHEAVLSDTGQIFQNELERPTWNQSRVGKGLPEAQNSPIIGNFVEKDVSSSGFELDGYDWIAMDLKSIEGDLPDGVEQRAGWFTDNETRADERDSKVLDRTNPPKGLNLYDHYIQLKPSVNTMFEGDMDAAHFAGTKIHPAVKSRLIVRELKIKIRIFDGYDWPSEVKRNDHHSMKNDTFVIDCTPDNDASNVQNQSSSTSHKKERLIGALLNGCINEAASTFRGIPLSEDRSAFLMNRAEHRRLARRMNRFLQLSLSGIQIRIDSFHPSTHHRLASCLDLRIQDFFIAETISNSSPTKLIGEWVNEIDHPRDTSKALLMLRMVTWNPSCKITKDNQLAQQECEAVMQFLPLRCYIHQRSLRFAKAFFSKQEQAHKKQWASHLTPVPPQRFLSFRVKSCKLKVNYTPEQLNVEALRNGDVVELINISPLNDMVIMLESVNMIDKIGFDEVLSNLTSTWVKDIVSTQLHKFVTNVSAFQPITSISTGALDMFVLPLEAMKNGVSVTKAMKKGVNHFTRSIVYETLNVGSKLANVAGSVLTSSSSSSPRLVAPTLPPRPLEHPKSMLDTTEHSMESLMKGLETANYKIIIIPFREFRQSGATGAAASILKGIPVAIMAPIGAASEALSYTLLGARNQIRPDIRKEEEASLRGLK